MVLQMLCCFLPFNRLLFRNAILVVPLSTQASSSCGWEVPPVLHSLVTAHSQRSQARVSGIAPRSGLGVQRVSLETEHKYQDPNNLITSGDIKSRIWGYRPLPFVFGEVQEVYAGVWMALQSVSAILLICIITCKDICFFVLHAKQCFSAFTSTDLQWEESPWRPQTPPSLIMND